MKKVNWVSLAALLLLVIVIPVYGFTEKQRLADAKMRLQDEYVMDGITLYVDNCAYCHNSDGGGIGLMPALNRSELAEAASDMLFKTIARSTHGTVMAAWHIDEGGLFTDYQVKELVALLQHGDWAVVERVAAVRGFQSPQEPTSETDLTYLNAEGEEDPHRCVACHEEPEVHAELFGLNCARCHNTEAWTPAVLTLHDFLLDHGDKGEVDCQTCHSVNYASYDCYGCHTDHQEDEMVSFHLDERISEITQCAACHPTGVAGEADTLRTTRPDLFSQSPESNLGQTNTATPLLGIGVTGSSGNK
jgi:hypothetical protein